MEMSFVEIITSTHIDFEVYLEDVELTGFYLDRYYVARNINQSNAGPFVS
jgi:23S rRNA G2069 N7-methylase RlmK/C1962 C5-methylase RlmI